MLIVPVFFLTAFFLKAQSKPERDFSGVPLRPLPTSVPLLLHIHYLRKSLAAVVTPERIHMCLSLRPPTCIQLDGVIVVMTSSLAPPSVSCNIVMTQSFTSELSWKVSMDGGGAFGGERMLLCCILFRIAPLFISQSINQALLQVSKNIFIYRHELVLPFFIWERKTFLYIPHKHNFILYSGTETLFCHFSDNIFQLLSRFLPAAQA